MIRVQTGQQNFYVELQPLRSFPVADIAGRSDQPGGIKNPASVRF
jgi:hypothetical protein